MVARPMGVRHTIGKGGREFPGPWGKSVSRNITSSKTAGIGIWTDAEIKTAITQGKHKDGTPLKPPMGYGYYAKMTTPTSTRSSPISAPCRRRNSIAAAPGRGARPGAMPCGEWRPSIATACGLYLRSTDLGLFAMPERLSLLRVFAVVVLALAPAQGALAQQRVVPSSPDALRLSYAPIVKRVTPAVVTVSAAKVVENRNPLMDDPFFRRFFGPRFGGPREQVQRSLGSGVIVDPSGLVVTNNHVIAGADQVKIPLPDKREFPVEIVLKDPRTDLAVLRVRDGRERFPVLEFGNSDQLQVGDVVLAVGNPFGVGQTVTHGIVSAVARTQVGISDYQFFIQTDAAINPGNSGGAAGRHGRPYGRHQHRDLLALGRLAGRRLRHSRQHGARGGGVGAHRRQRGEAALARRQAAGGDAGTVQGIRSQASGRCRRDQHHTGQPGGARWAPGRRRHRVGRRPAGRRSQRLRLPLHHPRRSAAMPSSASCAAAAMPRSRLRSKPRPIGRATRSSFDRARHSPAPRWPTCRRRWPTNCSCSPRPKASWWSRSPTARWPKTSASSAATSSSRSTATRSARPATLSASRRPAAGSGGSPSSAAARQISAVFGG